MDVRITNPRGLEEHEVTLLTKKERRKLLSNRVRVALYMGNHNEKYRLYDKMEKWCEANCTDLYWFRYVDTEYRRWSIYFLEPKDAVHFKLVWAGTSGEIA